MEVRLVQLLASFIGVSSDYALARLELTYRHPHIGAPPLIERLSDASEDTLREQWDGVEGQLEAAVRYVKQIEADRGNPLRNDPAFGWLERNTRQLDQYGRAVRWVLTVTQPEEDHHE
ncbi:MAG: hypothetical protein M3126_00315 [Candidatus Eremiobacteraeota bacterium]|nr:hypothetical protein [Candidatus Eremiobacteraeota bacterium]